MWHQTAGFVFAVKSTMIYCKPSCPSRRAARERVKFFELPVQAEAEGYRACSLQAGVTFR